MARLKNKIKIANKIKAKSIEAYLLCLEIYNKPTIHYRIEASSYFICNAWELILKAYYIQQYGENSIYRPNSKYSYSLEEMLNRCFEDNSPVKKNLLFILEKIRNKSTHFIIPEHDYIYTPFLQKAVLNYSKFLYDKFNVNIAEKIPFEYLALISRKEVKPKNISKLYSKAYADIFSEDFREVNETIANTESDDDAIFAQIKYQLALVKDIKQADIKAYYAKDEDAVALKRVTVAKDVNSSHPYSMKQLIKRIKQRVSDEDLEYDLDKLNMHSLSEFGKNYKITSRPDFIYFHVIGNTTQKTYSEAYVDFVISKIEDNPMLFAKK